MTELWKNRLAHFDEVPVVDFFGVMANQGAGGWASLEQKWPHEPEDIGFTGFDFDVWRVQSGDVQTTRIHMTAIISYKETLSLSGFGGKFRSHPIVHLKAKVARNPAGLQEALFVEWVGPATHDVELNELHRQLTEPVILDSPPLPPLELSTYDGAWHGTIILRSWEAFYLQSEPNYGGNRGAKFPLSIGSVPLPAVRLGYRGVPPSPEQVAAYVYLTENEKTVQDALLRAILGSYSQWQQNYGGDAEYMPDVTHREQFQSLLLLWDVSISCDAKEGYAYVYFSLLPNWDIEHGMGALLPKDRVVAVGDHDSIWDAAERDRESS